MFESRVSEAAKVLGHLKDAKVTMARYKDVRPL
jgi:hypothetical protein